MVIMLNYARSGGTLLNKCLASLPNVVMLSEINPLGGGWGKLQENSPDTVQKQALAWYGKKLKSTTFKDGIIELEEYCLNNNLHLIIRDWSFINFSKHRYNNFSPPSRFLSLEELSGIEYKTFGFIRNSIDVWISRGMPEISAFYAEYTAYLKELKEFKVQLFKYEDFITKPIEEFKKICNYIEIQYKDVFPECLRYSKVNGDIQVKDVSRGGKLSTIKPIPRKKISNKKKYEINNSEEAKIANDIANYKSGYFENFIKDKVFLKINYLPKVYMNSILKKVISKINIPKSEFGKQNQKNRDTWLEKTLKTIPKDQRILDAGAGELKYKKYCSHLKYVSQDFGQYNGLGDDKGLQTQSWDNSKLDIVCDITSIPETDNSFDAIMCIEVFEHLPSPIDAIKEFSRLIKKGGTLIITAPFASLTHFAPYHFYSGFNRYFYEKHLNDHGFEIKEIQTNGSFFEFIAQEFQLRIPNKYSNYTMSLKEKRAVNTILNMLEKMDKADSNSNELLTFGYHVKAEKK